MASIGSPTPVSSSAPDSALTWDVFLSYRGPDTGPNFTGHLYAALNRHGIQTYKDDYKLRMGDDISAALKGAIEESKIYIVVFSENYASSPWCLNELVDIVKFKKTEDRLIIPVFYKIDPSVVRHVSDGFEKAFQVHQEGHYKDQTQQVDNWRAALKEAANVSGEHVCEKNRVEADVIERIVDDILPRTNPKGFDEETVGLEFRVESIATMLSNQEGVTKIGIHGMGGVGKTTLAKAVFTKIYLRFEGSCFLANVTADSGTVNDMKSFQQQLLNDVLLQNKKDVPDVAQGENMIKAKLKNKKILVVIDDLNHSYQYESLGVESFGRGSVVIVTTRHEDVLEDFGVKTEYRHLVNELGPTESLLLFKRHAFRLGSKPDSGLMELSKDILSLADGLPLALKVFGSFLRTKYTAEEWRYFIDKLKETPNKEIQDRLLISFNAIDDDPKVKKMFLDVACFFVGRKKEKVFNILETYYTNVNAKINNLIGRCLLTINDRNELHMHDLLREMGREVARNNSPDEPENHSRLWRYEDICSVLTEESEESKAIEGIYYSGKKEVSCRPLATKTFRRMKKLRFLRLVGFNIPIESFNQTFKDLRWLSWKCCPLQYFPPEFKCGNLGILELRQSNMITLDLSMVFQNLKILDMAYSLYIVTTPDFNMLPCLVTLNFEMCTNLEQIHGSIGMLDRLVSLNLKDCWKLASLPKTIGNLKALKHLDVRDCESLVQLPEELVNIESLENLYMRGLKVENLPHSIHLLKNLIELNAESNKKLLSLPDNICKLRSLVVLNVVACFDLEALPEELGDITSLKVLDMSFTSVSNLPGSVGKLSNLVKLILSNNRNLKTLPETICNLRSLEILSIDNCSSLEELPGGMWKIESLRKLLLRRTKMLKVESSQIPLSLKTLDLSRNVYTALPLGISRLSNLEYLNVEECKRLLSIEELPPNLKELNASRCPSIKMFRAILKQLEILKLEGCSALEEIQGLDQLTSVKQFHFKGCRKLWSITGFPPHLTSIIANDCSSLKRLQNLSNMKYLEILDLTSCVSLTEIQGLEELSSIRELRLTGCSSSLQHIFTKRFFQIYSGLKNVIKISIMMEWDLPSWMNQLCDLDSRRRVSLDLTPSLSHNFLGTILCFKDATPVPFIDTYSIINMKTHFTWSDMITDDFLLSGSTGNYHRGGYIIIVPKSIFPLKNKYHRIDFTAAGRDFLAIHLLYSD